MSKLRKKPSARGRESDCTSGPRKPSRAQATRAGEERGGLSEGVLREAAHKCATSRFEYAVPRILLDYREGAIKNNGEIGGAQLAEWARVTVPEFADGGDDCGVALAKFGLSVGALGITDAAIISAAAHAVLAARVTLAAVADGGVSDHLCFAKPRLGPSAT